MRFLVIVLVASLAICGQIPDSVAVSESGPTHTAPLEHIDSSPTADSSTHLKATDFKPVTDSVNTVGLASRKSSLKRIAQVAVLSFAGEGIAAKDLAAVTSRFESEILATDSFKVVERRNVDKILREQGFQASGVCDNSECSVEIGQILSVDGIYTGELAKVGKTWSLSVKRTEVGTGQTVFSHVLDIQGSLEDVLRGGCPEMSLIASGRKKPESSRTVLVAKKASVWPWVVGGTVVVGGAVAAAILLTQDESAANNTNGEQPTNRTVDITYNTEK